MVKVLCQHLLGDTEYVTDSEAGSMIHQAVIQHVADVVQLRLRVRCERSVCPVYIHSGILLKMRKSNDHPVTILDYDKGPCVNQAILHRVPDRINGVPLIQFKRVHLNQITHVAFSSLPLLRYISVQKQVDIYTISR